MRCYCIFNAVKNPIKRSLDRSPDVVCIITTGALRRVGLKKFTAIINTKQTTTKMLTSNNDNESKEADEVDFVYD